MTSRASGLVRLTAAGIAALMAVTAAATAASAIEAVPGGGTGDGCIAALATLGTTEADTCRISAGGSDSRVARSVAVANTGGISGTATIGGQPINGGYVDLFTWAGEYLDTVIIGEGSYAFSGLADGSYKLLVSDSEGRATWVRLADTAQVTPAQVTVSGGTAVEVDAVDVTGKPFMMIDLDGKVGWDSGTMCVAAYKSWTFESEKTSDPVSADCVAHGSIVYLDGLKPGTNYMFRVVNTSLKAPYAWRVYGGDDFWTGNTGDPYERGTLVYAIPSPYLYSFISMAYFTDVDGNSSNYDPIVWVATEEIADGYADGSFRPTADVNRAQVARFLYRYSWDLPPVLPEESPFSDVSTSASNYEAIMWLTEEGLADGYADGTFRPTTSVNRAQMARFLYRFAGEPEVDLPEVSPFWDVATTSSNYAAIVWMTDAGIADGYGDGSFRPTRALNRAQAARFIANYHWWVGV